MRVYEEDPTTRVITEQYRVVDFYAYTWHVYIYACCEIAPACTCGRPSIRNDYRCVHVDAALAYREALAVSSRR